MSNRTARAYQIPTEQFKIYVAESRSIVEIALKCDYPHGRGGTSKIIKQRIQELNLDTSHFPTPDKICAKPLSDILTKNSTYKSTNNLKKRLINEGYLEEICTRCGQGTIWMGKPLKLHLDHIDGDSSNNLLENLRILCPLCHSQTSTFAGKNVRHKLPDKFCEDCGKKIGKRSTRCQKCNGIHSAKTHLRNHKFN